MKKTVIIFTIASIIAKIIAFGRELVLSYNYGAGEISDVFILSMTLPVTIFGFIATGVTSGYIPVYQKAKEDKGESVALRFTNNVVNTLIFICAVVIAVYLIMPRQLLGLFASGFDDKTLELARQFTNITIWATVFTAIVTVLSGYLQINDKIKITAFVSVPLNVGVIATIILASRLGNIYILPIGFLLSSAVQVIFLWVASSRIGYRYRISLNLQDEYLGIFLSSLAILVFSGSLQQVNTLIDRTLATTVTVGGLSIFEYGNRISDFVMGLTIIPVSTALFPMMAKVKDDPAELSKTLSDGIRLSSLIIIPASVIMMFFSDTIVRIIYFRGAFSAEDVLLTSEIVKLYGVGLIAFSIRDMILKCFYAAGDVKSPMINSAIGVICNIVLNFILIRFIGLRGLALATSISALICVVLLYRSLRMHLNEVKINRIVKQCVMLYVIAGVVCYGAYKLFEWLSAAANSIIIPFAASMLCFIAIYGFITIVTGIVSKNEIKSLIRK